MANSKPHLSLGKPMVIQLPPRFPKWVRFSKSITCLTYDGHAQAPKTIPVGTEGQVTEYSYEGKQIITVTVESLDDDELPDFPYGFIASEVPFDHVEVLSWYERD